MSEAPGKGSLSVTEKVMMALKLGTVVPWLFYQAAAAIFRDKETTRSWMHEMRNRFAHHCLTCFSVDELPYTPLFPSTESVVAGSCRKLKWPREIQDIPGGEGARIHWLGDQKAKHVLLWFHGGGFALPANPGHTNFLAECQKKLDAAGKNVLVALVEYTLTPYAKFPTQPKQCLLAYKEALGRGYGAENIIIGGDSAGGNLAVSLLLSLHHHPPSLPQVSSQGIVAGLCLVSPWISYSGQSESFKRFNDYDIVLRDQVLDWADRYQPSPLRDIYSEPARAGPDDWKDLPVKKVLLLASTGEVLHDDIIEMGQKMEKGGLPMTVVQCPKSRHIECIQDAQVGLTPGTMSEAVWEWLPTVCT
ncbi:Alpha/Beta hydrolase protein [Lineolata rhizophorae]|uniref:Alpha/Beta hydrolase protein n=1 Tax=Lineolata rhizophorae TaxID=578093 RepID=A0A6A6NM67_9PEZI|nr:Alpha/Beta hydrolase protein [Lineolata rhizophorae]